MRVKRPLIIGADGGIGKELTAALRVKGCNPLATTRRSSASSSGGPEVLYLDLADMASWTPPETADVAFLCAAITATDQCRKDPAGTRRVNVENTVLLADRLVRSGWFVFFLSTNLVFDGSTPLCAASAPVNPRTEYGRQKAEAEARLQALGSSVAILRLSKVLTPDFSLFSRWAGELSKGRPVAPFHDMTIAPVPMGLLIQVLLDLAESPMGGIWQLSAMDEISYAQAALQLCRSAGYDETLVRPVSWREACPDLEHVPAHTTLDCSRLAQAFGFTPLSAQDALMRTLGDFQ
ncbi:MAG: sugar nucleotide-binding protein [Proteobacteria bacterium]|nr:sugar nucleotide-binding protein [Pseudomonadota bacterium]